MHCCVPPEWRATSLAPAMQKQCIGTMEQFVIILMNDVIYLCSVLCPASVLKLFIIHSPVICSLAPIEVAGSFEICCVIMPLIFFFDISSLFVFCIRPKIYLFLVTPPQIMWSVGNIFVLQIFLMTQHQSYQVFVLFLIDL